MTDLQLYRFLWCVLLYIFGTLIYFSLTLPTWFVAGFWIGVVVVWYMMSSTSKSDVTT